MHAQKVLVTGGAGAIGRNLVKQLVFEGYEVIVLDNLFRSISTFSAPELQGAKFFNVDIRDYAAIKNLFVGVDVVYHLAAFSNVRGAQANSTDCWSINVDGTLNVVLACMAAGVKHLIFTSSREVYGNPIELPVPETAKIAPINVYGTSKAKGEEILKQVAAIAGFKLTIFRLANVVCLVDEGRVLHILHSQASNGRDLTIFGGQQRIDFIWVHTVVTVLIAALYSESDGPINVGGGRTISLLEIAERFMFRFNVQLNLLPANAFEVSEFQADITKLLTLGIDPSKGLDAVELFLQAMERSDKKK